MKSFRLPFRSSYFLISLDVTKVSNPAYGTNIFKYYVRAEDFALFLLL